jgi:guanylate kinase
MEVRENHLEQLDEFRQVLANYHVAPGHQKMLAQTRLAFLVGPSASGRDTVLTKLLESGHYHFIISDTTRHPRVNDGVLEQNGRDYWFRTEEQFLADLKAGKYLEAEIMFNQQVSGISLRELENFAKRREIGIRNIDLNVAKIVAVKPDTLAFLVVPPSFEEWMRRLESRGGMHPADKQRRLVAASQIFAAGLEWGFFTFIVNDDLDHAVEQIHNVAVLGKKDQHQQAQARLIIEKLLVDTHAYLKARDPN